MCSRDDAREKTQRIHRAVSTEVGCSVYSVRPAKAHYVRWAGHYPRQVNPPLPLPLVEAILEHLNGPDGCLVPTAPLADVLGGFVSTWNRDRPQTGGRFHAEGEETISPVRAAAWLSANSGVPEKEVTRIVARKTEMTAYSYADRLMTVIGREDLFYDGDPPTLPLYPDPQASLSRQASCCGGAGDFGSLNGSGSW